MARNALLNREVLNTIRLEAEECCACGLDFGVPDWFMRRRRNDHANFFCPSCGTPQRYMGETEVERLRKELDAKERRLQATANTRDFWHEEAKAAERRVSAQKGQVTKLKKRAKAGMCIACNRSFQQLQRHMDSQHPDLDPHCEDKK